MFNWMRNKFGPIIVGTIIGAIALVFVLQVDLGPQSGNGRKGSSIAGSVNGEPILASDFSLAVKRQMQMFQNMGGGQIPEELLGRLRESVFQELVTRKIKLGEARKMGKEASDEEVRQKIAELPVFQKEGRFDPLTYKQVLTANRYSPGQFEGMIREDVTVQKLDEFFKSRVHVSEQEIEKEFLISGEKRNIKYVLLTDAAGAKDVQVSDAEIKAFAADEKNLNLAKSDFDRNKPALYKDKKFEDVRDAILRKLVAGQKGDEVRKANQALAARILPLLSSDSSGDAKLNAVLKSYNLKFSHTGLVNRVNKYLPGLGEVKGLLDDAFSASAPISKQAKVYNSNSWFVVATVSETKEASMSELSKERDRYRQNVLYRKERGIVDELMQGLQKTAKIEKNEQAISGASGG